MNFGRLRGCVYVLVAVLVGGVLLLFRQPAPKGGTLTATARPDARPSATITDTPPATWTLDIRAAEVTQSAAIFVIEPVVYYAESEVNVRGCANTDCPALGQIAKGTALVVDAMLDGEEVQTRNWVWYRVDYNGQVGYVYSGVMQRTQPEMATRVPTVTAIPIRVNPQQVACPSNCDEARALGWTEQQAGQCANLDRDRDGVACHGD